MINKKSLLIASGVISVIPSVTMAEEVVQKKESTADRPNIILIVSDDQGYGGLSCYPQNRPMHTPNIDKLASDGVRFTDAYTSGHYSSPTRAGLLTGKYQQSFGFYSLAEPAAGGIPTNEKIISQYLKEAGYSTAAIGKWHVGDNLPNHPNNRAFDYFYGFVDGQHDYFDPIIGGSWSGWFEGLAYMMENMDPVVKMKYATYEFTDRAVDFIKEKSGSPFFLYLPYNAIHGPLQAPEELIQETSKNPGNPNRNELLHAMTIALDTSVGRVIDALEESGVRDNTLVIYLSDNGGPNQSDNWKLRGMKGSYYEGGIRVPFIMSWPDRIPKTQTFKEPIISIDIAPTILSATNLFQNDMDGVDLLPYLTGERKDSPHDILYWSTEKESDIEIAKNEFAVRQGKWKLVSDPLKVKDCNLYNLEDDPFETKGLKEKHPEKYKELFGLYLDWINQMPPSLTKSGNWRMDGKAMMRKYQQNYKKEFGTTPKVRVININESTTKQ